MLVLPAAGRHCTMVGNAGGAMGGEAREPKDESPPLAGLKRIIMAPIAGSCPAATAAGEGSAGVIRVPLGVAAALVRKSSPPELALLLVPASCCAALAWLACIALRYTSSSSRSACGAGVIW